MDPFSVVAGTIGVADVCVRVLSLLKQARSNFSQVDKRLDDFRSEVGLIKSISERIREVFSGRIEELGDVQARSKKNVAIDILEQLQACGDIVLEFERTLEKVEGDAEKKNRLEQFRKWRRQQQAEDDVGRFQSSLKVARECLQLRLVTYSIIIGEQSRVTRDPRTKIQNVHFSAQAVSSIFTGRTEELSQLESWMFSDGTDEQRQRRFVICGPPGSGKTEFCCKFATDNKDRFWGVFWIDASTEELARQSFKNLASIGQVEQSDIAVKSWLATRDQPWLLILDNVDQKSFHIKKHYPGGTKGVVMITTRNVHLKVEGTVGPGYFAFHGLDKDEAIDLLLRASCEESRSSEILARAERLCEQMDFLPLAITLAGKTIMSRSWSIEHYLDYYSRGLHLKKTVSSNASPTGMEGEETEEEEEDEVISGTYDLLQDALMASQTEVAKDALEILYIMAFLHPRRIRRTFFLRAVTNPILEAHAENDTSSERQVNRARPNADFRTTMWKAALGMLLFLVRVGTRPVLPKFMQESDNDTARIENRIKRAFLELSNMSLVYASADSSHTYSVHPAVHNLIRKRLSKEIHEQAVWTQLAATILSRLILLPPLGDRDEDQILKRDLLPHVQCVEKIETIVTLRILDRRRGRVRSYPNLASRMSSERARQMVKFSQVYKQAGFLTQAAEHLENVLSMVRTLFGPSHPTSVGLSLLLADTYWHQTRGEDAGLLLKSVMETCLERRGPLDYWTLRLSDAYGGSLWVQGLIPQALAMSKSAVDGLTKILGPENADTLRALSNYGRTLGKDFRFNEAIEINERALSGLRKVLGQHHLDTLAVQDNLAMAYFDRAAFGFEQEGDLDRALAFEQDVFERRIARLGRDHYVTLWSGLNLARIKGIRGDVAEALSLWEANHAMAEPLLGPTHFGVLFGRLHHARILMYAKRYVEAEVELRFVVDEYPEERKNHPDRLIALFTLVKCRMLQGEEISKLRPMMEAVATGAKALFGEDHPWIRYLNNPLQLSDEIVDTDLIRVDSPRDGATEGVLGAEQRKLLSLYGSVRSPSPLPKSQDLSGQVHI